MAAQRRKCITCGSLDEGGASCAIVLRLPISAKDWVCEHWECRVCGGGHGAPHFECGDVKTDPLKRDKA